MIQRTTATDVLRWVEASAEAPCPCCGARDGCSTAPDVGFVRCRAVVSTWPMEGGGWLHPVPSGKLAGAP